MDKMTKEERNRICERFFKHIATVISTNRTKIGMKQEELALLLNCDRSVISNLENAKPVKTLSRLPLISHFCEFDISDYFHQPNVDSCLMVLTELIHILAIEPKAKLKPSSTSDDDYRPIGILMSNIKNPQKTYIKNTKPKVVQKTYVWQTSKFKGNIQAYDPTPISTNELREYLSRSECRHICDLLEAANTLLNTSRKSPTTAEKKQIAEYVISRFLEEPDVEIRNRLIIYFRMHFESYNAYIYRHHS